MGHLKSSMLLTLLLVASDIATIAFADTFIGCANMSVVDRFSYWEFAGPNTTAGDSPWSCSEYCGSMGYSNAGFARSPDGEAANCYCTYTIPSAPAADLLTDGYGSDCEDGTIRIASITTYFHFDRCHTSPPTAINSPTTASPLMVPKGQLGSFEACFTACDAYTHAYVSPIPANGTGPLSRYDCACSDCRPQNKPRRTQCGSRRWFSFTQPKCESRRWLLPGQGREGDDGETDDTGAAGSVVE
ncbi:hypothetical protein IAU60_000873 [Kwoniella sp. DSM 27419]